MPRRRPGILAWVVFATAAALRVDASTADTAAAADAAPSSPPDLVAIGEVNPSAPICPVQGICPVPTSPPKAITPVRDRQRRLPEPAEADQLRRFQKVVRAPGGVVEDPCVEPGPFCTPALAAFFTALDQSAAGGRVEVAFFGNSLIAGDRIVDVVRARLVEQFGDGGRGFLLVDRMAPYGRRDRTAAFAQGWTPATVADVSPNPAARGVPFGVAGALHVADVDGARSRFPVGDHTSLTVFGWHPQNARAHPPLWVRLDSGPWQRLDRLHQQHLDADDVVEEVPDVELPSKTEVDAMAGVPVKTDADDGPRDDPRDTPEATRERPAPTTEPAVSVAVTIPLPPGTRTIELKGARGAVAQGVVLEHDRGGVVVDTFGVAASDAGYFLDADEAMSTAQLGSRSPSLLVMMLGGNEAKRVAWNRRSYEETDVVVRTFLRRLKQGAPTASCLVVGPIDGVINRDAKEGQDPMTPRPQVPVINEQFRTIAREEGCAFFDLYAAMGGRGSLARFKDRGVLHDDLVHPKGKGLDVLGQMLADALLDSYRRTPPLTPRVNERGETVLVPVAPRTPPTPVSPDTTTTTTTTMTTTTTTTGAHAGARP